MMVLRVLSAEKCGKKALDIAGLLKIKGSEIQQRYSELMMLAAGPYALPLRPRGDGSRLAGRLLRAPAHCAPLAVDLLQHAQDHDLRRLATKCNATSSRRRCWAEETDMDFDFTDDQEHAARRGAQVGRQGLRLRAPPRHRQGRAASRATAWTNSPSSAWPASHMPEAHGGMGMGPVEAMVVMEELGRGIVLEPYAPVAGRRRRCWRGAAPTPCKAAWLPRIAGGEALVVLAHQERAGALPPRLTCDATADAGRQRLAAERRTRASSPPATRPTPSSCRRASRRGDDRRHRACSWSSAGPAGVAGPGYATQDGAPRRRSDARRRRRPR